MATTTPSAPAEAPIATPRRFWRGAVAGMLSVAAALATGELVSALAGQSQTPLLAVGTEFIDRFAAQLKEFAVAVFGTNDKPALLIGTVVITLLLGAVAGLATRAVRLAVPVLIAVLAAVGLAAQLADARTAAATAAVGAVAAVAVGVLVWRWLLGRAETAERTGGQATRRSFLLGTGVVGVGAIAAAGLSRAAADSAPDVTADVNIPTAGTSVDIPDTSEFDSEGISPYVTANDDFYRIDTALAVPRVDATGWSLKITGLVDNAVEISYADLLAMPSVQVPVTLQCVSNEVGGDLVDNAVWQGVPLLDVLALAGVQAGAEQVFTTSVDGWTAGFPVSALTPERTAIVAYAMNGEPLPAEHGFPARLVVAGLYGYVSATKWVTEIELTTWAGRDGYWVPRGWAKEGPIKLTSRIDVPRSGESVTAGQAVLGGVAWLPSVGVSTVEVQIDGGDWVEAELGPVADDDTWVQWRLPVPDLAVGDHRAVVRARDADGQDQVVEEAPPAPDGASGLHSREFAVVG